MPDCDKSTIFAANNQILLTYNKQMSASCKMRKFSYIIVLLLTFTWPVVVSAQQAAGTISGVVIDSQSEEPVGFASAALLTQASKSYVKGMQTVDDGKILFTDVEPGVYAIRITYVGYENYLKEQVTVEAGQHVELGNILLKASGELLEEVIVEGTPPPMQLGIDR